MQGAKLYEAHLNSSNLERSIKFYENLGFKVAYTTEDRKAAFFFVGENKENMLGIWETKDTPIRKNHIAFSVSPEKLRGIIPFLTEKRDRGQGKLWPITGRTDCPYMDAGCFNLFL
ncbi:VOC family protein [Cytobacillus firmus]|uniref:VOC family protein n=1 Tax=Cytobacillus firmus TaxID=1399 RepID=UPI0021C8A8C4|nr:VOC family protein [Cytobacillus firmus]MCU1803982.1 VOC family protein [Cytobacillus firmus]